jgi:hypothetical protein
MRTYLRDFGRWLWLVISGWLQYAEAGSTALVWVLIEKLREHPFSWKTLGVSAVAFLFFAFFNVWRDEMKKHSVTKLAVSELTTDLQVLRAQKTATAVPVAWADLNREQIRLEDEVARKEAEIEHNTRMASVFSSPLTSILGAMHGPDKNTLLRGDIERLKNRIEQIDQLLGRAVTRHPQPLP